MAEIQGKSILVRVSARFELELVIEGSSYRESTVFDRFVSYRLSYRSHLAIDHDVSNRILDGFQEVMVIPSSPPPENDH